MPTRRMRLQTRSKRLHKSEAVVVDSESEAEEWDRDVMDDDEDVPHVVW